MVARWLPATPGWYFYVQVKRKGKASWSYCIGPRIHYDRLILCHIHSWNRNDWTCLGHMIWCPSACLCVHMHTGTHTCKSTMLIFEAGSPTGLELMNSASLAGHWVPGICLSLLLQLGSQRRTTTFSFFFHVSSRHWTQVHTILWQALYQMNHLKPRRTVFWRNWSLLVWNGE